MASSTSSISGLVSGLDTTTIISQLMQLEAQPQTNLKNQVAQYQTQVASMQTVNAKLAAIATKSTDLAKAATWSPIKATSSNTNVSVTTSGAVAAASLTFTVDQVATATTVDYGTHLLTDKVTANGSSTVYLTMGTGTPVPLDTKDGSVKGLVDAINATDNGVRASAVLQSDGSYRLQVKSSQLGTSTAFTLKDAAGNDLSIAAGSTTTAGLGAQIHIGTDQPLTSSSNTFTNVMPGVNITLAPGATGSVDINLSRDTASLSDKVQAMVDSVNAALDDIDSLTSYDASTNTAGILQGDPNLRSIRDSILSTVSGGLPTASGGYKSYASVGIQTDKTGRLTFDASKFTDAYNADPSGTTNLFAGSITYPAPNTTATGTVTLQGATWRTVEGTYTVDQAKGQINGLPATSTGTLLTGQVNTPVEGLTLDVSAGALGSVTFAQGLAAKFEALAQRASNSSDGTVTAEINGTNSSIDGMNKDIADWDVRLQAKQDQLKQQYAALEVALGKMQDQASWLSGQIASLPTSGG